MFSFRAPTTVVQSSAEAELGAIRRGAINSVLIANIGEEMAGETLTINIFSDSSAGRAIACRRGQGRARHLSARQLFVQLTNSGGRVQILRASTDDNPADHGAKVLPMTAAHKHMRRAGFEVPGETGDHQVSVVTLDSHGRGPPADGHCGQENGGPLSRLRHKGQRAASALAGGLARSLKALAELRGMRRGD